MLIDVVQRQQLLARIMTKNKKMQENSKAQGLTDIELDGVQGGVLKPRLSNNQSAARRSPKGAGIRVTKIKVDDKDRNNIIGFGSFD